MANKATHEAKITPESGPVRVSYTLPALSSADLLKLAAMLTAAAAEIEG